MYWKYRNMKNTQKSKIVFIGGEDVSARIQISQKLKEKNFDIEIIGSESIKKFDAAGIKYRKYNLYREFSIKNDFKTILELRNY